METSPTSSNTPTIMSNTFVDKPDELVSSGSISQQHQKKCLHHRLSLGGFSNPVDHLTAILLQHRSVYYQMNSVQTQPSQQQQVQQQPQQQSVSYGRNFVNGNIPMAANNGNASVINGNANSVAIIPNQNGLVQHMNAALLAERYLLLDMVDGSTLYKCMDVKTHEELVCKVRPSDNKLSFSNSIQYHSFRRGWKGKRWRGRNLEAQMAVGCDAPTRICYLRCFSIVRAPSAITTTWFAKWRPLLQHHRQLKLE